MKENNLLIKCPRQRRAVQALIEKTSILVKDMVEISGALNPRQTVMELRRQGFLGIIKTRRLTQQDQDGKLCHPGEYFIPSHLKHLAEDALKRNDLHVERNTKIKKENLSKQNHDMGGI